MVRYAFSNWSSLLFVPDPDKTGWAGVAPLLLVCSHHLWFDTDRKQRKLPHQGLESGHDFKA